jgi:hypothetical protein
MMHIVNPLDLAGMEESNTPQAQFELSLRRKKIN